MGDDRYEPVEFEDVAVKVVKEKALLCKIDDKTVWIPLSQIHDDSEIYHNSPTDCGLEGKLVIPQWLAEEKGLV